MAMQPGRVVVWVWSVLLLLLWAAGAEPVRVRNVVGWCLIVLAVWAAWMTRGLEADNRLERWMGSDHEAAEVYRDLRETFGSDELVVIAVRGPALLEPATLDLLVDAVGRLEQVPGVQRVQGLPVIYRDVFGSEDPEALAEEALGSPFYRGLFISAGGGVLGLVLQVEPEDDPRARQRIRAGVLDAVEPLEQAGLEVHAVGSTVLAAALDDASIRGVARTLPIALALAAGALALLLRSWRATAVVASSALLTVVLTLGLMAAAGRGLSMVTSALPALLGVLALAGAVHVVRRYQVLRAGMSQAAAIDLAVAQMRRPCTLAAITTALGFLSLIVADLQPVRELGVLAALGLMISLAVNLTVAPLLLRWLRAPGLAVAAGSASDRRPGIRALLGLAGTAMARPWTVLVSTALIVAAVAAVLPWIRVASNPLSFLPSDSDTVAAYDMVGDSLGGFYTLELVLNLPEPWLVPEASATIEELGRRLEADPAVARVLSPVDLLRQLNRWELGLAPGASTIPATEDQARRLVAALDPEGARVLAGLATADGTRVRLAAVVREMDEGRLLDLAATARRLIAALPEGWSGRVTGMVLQLVSAQKALVRSQIESLGLALVVVVLAIGIGLRSVRNAVLSVVPNVLPILSVFGVMALASIPLDAATAMVASIALGIGVDDAVHLLEGLARRGQEQAPAEALRDTLIEVGPALVVTTVTACIGFFALGASAFVPIGHFGVLAGIALLVALAADVVVVPALASVWSRNQAGGQGSGTKGAS